MSKAAVIFWSQTGNTEQMANAIADGIREGGMEVDVLNVADTTPADAVKYAKIALGCPAMGAEVLEETEFDPFFTELESKISGNDTENERLKAVQAIADAEGAMVLPICAKLEEDIAGMDAEEKEMFLSELGLHESGLDRLIKVCYDLLGLMSYLTAGEQEVRAWTIEKGTKAPQAAGKIHTDFERGFIRAEVINYKDLIELGSLAAAREKGLVRSEGKEYVMQDGDVVLFRFNV